jgi:hypothetical protein
MGGSGSVGDVAVVGGFMVYGLWGGERGGGGALGMALAHTPVLVALATAAVSDQAGAAVIPINHKP